MISCGLASRTLPPVGRRMSDRTRRGQAAPLGRLPLVARAWDPLPPDPVAPTGVPRRRPGAGGTTLATVEVGEGGRPLLLIHGFTGAKEDFADWFDRFAEAGWWVVAPDLRGHGDSDQPPDEDDYSLPVLADDLGALVDDLGWDRYALVGHSMGGMVAQEVVLRPGHGVERLVLMDTHHGPIEGLSPEVVELGLEVLRRDGLPALLALLAELGTQPPAPADARLRAERAGYAAYGDWKMTRVSPAMYAAMASELVHRPDRLAELAGLTDELSVLVVVGEQDRTFRGAADRMGEAIGHASTVVIDDAAHSPQFEHPEAWWAAVAPFLSAATPASPGAG